MIITFEIQDNAIASLEEAAERLGLTRESVLEEVIDTGITAVLKRAQKAPPAVRLGDVWLAGPSQATVTGIGQDGVSVRWQDGTKQRIPHDNFRYYKLVHHKGEAEQQQPKAPAKPLTPQQELRATIWRAAVELNARERLGGLVPIPRLRRAVEPLGISKEQFDAALLEAQRAYTKGDKHFPIDLKVANDRRLVEEPEGGIEVRGRGLVYFAVPHEGNDV